MNIIQRIECAFGFHDDEVVDFVGYPNPIMLMRCECCKKHGVYLAGVNSEFWSKDTKKVNSVIEEYTGKPIK